MTIGPYEQSCIDFALYGDPEREHYDHEFNAQFDRYDGWGDPDPCDNPDYDDRCEHGNGPDCPVCAEIIARWEAEFRAERSDSNDDVPF